MNIFKLTIKTAFFLLLVNVSSSIAKDCTESDCLIGEIQGASFESPYDGKTVSVTGKVTMILNKWTFSIQGTSDNSSSTSDALLVYAPNQIKNKEIILGETYRIKGRVEEYRPPSFRTFKTYSVCQSPKLHEKTKIVFHQDKDKAKKLHMPITELIAKTVVRVDDKINIEPFSIAQKLNINSYDDDQRTVFDPENDALDRLESLESMVIEIKDAVAISSTNSPYAWVMSEKDHQQEETSSKGGVILSTIGEINSRRLQVQFPRTAKINLGQKLGNLTGVMTYGEGVYFLKLLPSTIIPEKQQNQKLIKTKLVSNNETITIASYNLHNLSGSPKESNSNTFTKIARQIAFNLQSPDILAVQEMGDNDGSLSKENTESYVVSSDQVAQHLIEEIIRIGGEEYSYYDLPPELNCDGGKPGLNIRTGFFIKSTLVKKSNISKSNLTRLFINESAYENSRKPLLLSFSLGQHNYKVLNIHLSSKRSDDGFTTSVLNPVRKSELKRHPQIELIRSYIDEKVDAEDRILILGDFNDFWFSESLSKLSKSKKHTLVNGFNKLVITERYSYVYQGNSQNLDQIITNIKEKDFEFEALHINTHFFDQASDHDPMILRVDN